MRLGGLGAGNAGLMLCLDPAFLAQLRPHYYVIMETDCTMAPSTGQPLSGQGVLGIPRSDGYMATNSCSSMVLVTANPPSVDVYRPNVAPSTEQPLNGQGVLSIPRSAAVNVDDSSECPPITVSTTSPKVGGEGSSVATFEPFTPVPKKKKRQVFKPHPALHHFDSLFGSDNWARFLVLKAGSHIASSILENELLHACPSAELGFRLLRPNEWLVEATTKLQSESIMSIKTVAGVDVHISRHDTLNYIQGTVVLPHIQDEALPSKAVLLDSLQIRYNNVHDIELFEIPSRKNKNVKLSILKLKFTGHSIPQKIKVLGVNREVRPYVPKPLQCNSCCRFGHSSKRCTSPEVCAVCGSGQHLTNWNCDPPKCVNCGLSHHAKCKTCVFYIYNTELKLLMTRSGMSAKEAKLELRVRGLQDPGRNPAYRTALSKSSSERGLPHVPSIADPISSDVPRSQDAEVISPNQFDILETVTVEPASTAQEICSEETLSKKRALDRTPPKSKKKTTVKIDNPSLSVRPKHSQPDDVITPVSTAPSSEDISDTVISRDDTEVSPSPILGRPTTRRSQPLRVVRSHNDSCGCHSCFLSLCHQHKNLGRDTLLTLIRGFVKTRHKDSSALESHKKGCMCVAHLAHYKDHHVKFVDKFLDNFRSPELAKTSSHTKDDLQKDHLKYLSNYSKINSQSTSTINRTNLTTLT